MNTSIPPAQLWLGPTTEHLQEQLERYLQTILCTHQSCSVCKVCTMIKNHQHHAIAWFKPEKNYSVEQLTHIVDLLSLSLNSTEHYFIILQKSDLLTPASANRLLKSIEEPPPGYHFILLAQRRDSILPTIRSRCIIRSFYQDQEPLSAHPLLRFFTHSGHSSPAEFLKELEASKITEQESVELLDAILAYWLNQYKKAYGTESPSLDHIINLLTQAVQTPPMPGSSKIFWKNLFVRLNR